MVEQLSEFKQELKRFIDSKQTADDYLKLLTIYETARNKGVKVSSVIMVLEEQTKTKVPDDLDA